MQKLVLGPEQLELFALRLLGIGVVYNCASGLSLLLTNVEDSKI